MIDAIWVLNSTILTWFALSLLGEPVLERVVIYVLRAIRVLVLLMYISDISEK